GSRSDAHRGRLRPETERGVLHRPGGAEARGDRGGGSGPGGMSDEVTFFGAGITAEVHKVRPTAIGQAGIAFAAVPCPSTGQPALAVTLVHPDGTALCV